MKKNHQILAKICTQETLLEKKVYFHFHLANPQMMSSRVRKVPECGGKKRERERELAPWTVQLLKSPCPTPWCRARGAPSLKCPKFLPCKIKAPAKKPKSWEANQRQAGRAAATAWGAGESGLLKYFTQTRWKRTTAINQSIPRGLLRKQ